MKILIVGPAWVGDMVMAQSLFKMLKLKHPDAVLHVLAPAWSLPIIARMQEISDVVEMPLGHGEMGLFTRYQLGKKLRDRAYDQAIVIPRSYKAALVPWFAKIPKRTGYKGEFRWGLINDARVLDKTILQQTVQRYVALGLDASTKTTPAIIYPQLSGNKSNQQLLIKNFSLKPSSLVAFMPGAEYGPAKCWPVDYFSKLADMLLAEGKQIIILGSDKDIKAGEDISKSRENILNLCGKTRLEDVSDLLALTQQAVTNDSGLMHVACAVGTEVFGIYGSSDPACTPPLSQHSTIIQQAISCSPCLARRCRYDHYDCLKNISPETVFEKMRQSWSSL